MKISLSPLQKYFVDRVQWYAVTLLIAITLNFILPRLGPSNPVDTLMTKVKTPGMTSKDYKKIYENYMHEFNLDKPIYVQFGTYLWKTLHGDLGRSFVKYPLKVWDIIGPALPWTLALQVITIVIGYIVGNILGALAAYKRGVYDKVFYPLSLFFMSVPYFCLGIILVYVFGMKLGWFPAMGGYAIHLNPGWTWPFISSVLYHYFLPFMTMVLVFMGGQAIGMRSMSIYELGTDYIKYAKMLGIKESRIVAYVFRNAMLPQLTGLALALGFAIGGSLLIEIVFSYPGVGMALYSALKQNDYPVIQADALIVTTVMLAMNFLVDIVIGFMDPRVRVSQEKEA